MRKFAMHPFPAVGVRVVSRPFWNQEDSSIYYKLYKLDNAAQKDVMLAFGIPTADTFHYGQLIDVSTVNKTDDSNWIYNHVHNVPLRITQSYVSECVQTNFDHDNAGEYRFNVFFSRPLFQTDLSAFENKLGYGDRLCGNFNSDVTDVKYLSFYDYFYLREVHCYVIIIVFLLIILLFIANFIVKKISTHVRSNRHNPENGKAWQGL